MRLISSPKRLGEFPTLCSMLADTSGCRPEIQPFKGNKHNCPQTNFYYPFKYLSDDIVPESALRQVIRFLLQERLRNALQHHREIYVANMAAWYSPQT